MNDVSQTVAASRAHPGRIYLTLGVLVPLAGMAIYALRLRAFDVSTPWYAPILATVGVLLVAAALAQSRSLWRWMALVFVTLVAGGEWVSGLVLLRAPDYTGPAKKGEPFPDFTTTLADGSTFDQDRLKGDRNTVMVFFRGRW
jgi:hypothetical protein